MAVKKKAASTKPAKAAKAAPVIEMAPATDMPPPVDIKPVAQKKTKTARYVLPGNMEIAALAPVHADLVAMEASNDGPFVLDGGQLSVIDTAGLQLLISFVSAVKSSGKKVSWDNYSVQAYQLANELGVVEQLGD
jgi:ABC-type transporter Mla MlaB component